MRLVPAAIVSIPCFARLGLLCSVLALCGCASVTPPAPALSITAPPSAAPAAAPAVLTVEPDVLPAMKLTDELFYKILTAEIAQQRGHWQAAYITLLGLAQQTRDPRLARRSAEIALAAKEPGEALAAIRLWRELAPNSMEAGQYYLGFMVMQGQLEEVTRFYAPRLAQAQPEQHSLLLLQAQRLLGRAHDKTAGFAQLEQLAQPYLHIPDVHLALAHGAQTLGNTTRAAQEARIVLAGHSDSQLAILTLAQALKAEDAVPELRAFLHKNPGTHDVRLALGSMLIDLKRWDEAQETFTQLLADQPGDLHALYTLGVLAAEKKQVLQAEHYLQRFLAEVAAHPQEERDTTGALIHLAQLAIERNDYAAAESWLARIDSYGGRNPAWLGSQIRRALLLDVLGKKEAALHLLDNLPHEDRAAQLQVLQARAQIERDHGDLETALTLLEQALALQPDHADLLYDHAMLADSMKRYELMERSLRRLIESHPEHAQAYNALGYSLADRNLRLEEALSLIEHAHQLAPQDPYILDSLGWAHFRLQQFSEAERLLRLAYQQRQDAEIAAHLGEVLWAQNKKEEALLIWRAGRAQKSDNATLNDTLQRLHVQP